MHMEQGKSIFLSIHMLIDTFKNILKMSIFRTAHDVRMPGACFEFFFNLCIAFTASSALAFLCIRWSAECLCMLLNV
jgi:hypothetical protein